MAYVINKSDGTAFTTLQDSTLDTSSSLTLVGRNYIGYGEIQNENFLFLLENFANISAPAKPISGQLWFDTNNNVLKIYDGAKWIEVGSASLSTEAPENPSLGAFWFKPGSNVLYTWNGTSWAFVGPETAEGYGITRARSTVLLSDTGTEYPVILITVADIVIAIVSSSPFTINSSNAIEGFNDIQSGITLSSIHSITGNLNGNANTATALDNLRTINGVGFNGTKDITLKATTNFKLRAGDYIVSTAQAQQAIETLTITGAGLAAVNTKLFYRGLTISGDRIWADNLLNDPQLDSTVYLAEQPSAYILVDRTSGKNYQSFGGKPANPWEITSWNTAQLSTSAPAPYPTITVGQTVSSSSKDFDGSNEVSFNVYAKTSNIAGSVVARDSGGDFSAGTITADLEGNVTGNVTANSGTSRFDVVEANRFVGQTLTGNAFSATKLRTSREINGVPFDGQSDITVPASARTLTDTALAANVVSSQLESVGELTSLVVNGTITVSSNHTIAAGGSGSTTTATRLMRLVADDGTDTSVVDLIAPDVSVAAGYGTKGSIMPSVDESLDLGKSARKFDNVHANTFNGDLVGNADTATLAITATNIAGGAAGSVAYQTASGATALLPIGAANQVLKSTGTTVQWGAPSLAEIIPGNYITGNNYDGLSTQTWAVDADTANTVNKVVARDSSGNFAAGTITANLSGNSSTATALETARTINGVGFDGTGNITITATDPNAVPRAGGTMTGRLTLSADPTSALHAATKQYVDDNLGVTIVSGSSSAVGYTNQVGSFNNNSNYFDVYPPAGKTMSDLIAFIPSIRVIHYAGGVDGNDSIRCTYSILSNRIRVYVQNTEQRSKPAANYLGVWR